jgi:Uma2 family endonuclease
MTEEEYLERERAADYKSEYILGEVFAMSGGRFRHNRLAARFIAELDRLLVGKNCWTLTSDTKVRSPKTRSYLYPDVTVACGEIRSPEKGPPDVLLNPVVVVEVLSPSTEQYDRGVKFDLYREIESLKDYILVRCQEPWVEHFSRQEGKKWLYWEHRGTEASFEIPSLGCTLHLNDLYRDAMEIPE